MSSAETIMNYEKFLESPVNCIMLVGLNYTPWA